MIPHSTNFVFFGTDEFSVIVLDELKRASFIPSLMVTAPDRRKNRGLMLTPPPVKIWAQKNNIRYMQPEKLEIRNLKFEIEPDLFIVASYGKIIPKEILGIPKHGTLNVHPSLLPLFRGPSPIHSQILKNTRMVGVTIMLMDEKVDHGPIVAQKALQFSIFNFQFSKVRDTLAHLGGKLLAQTIPEWVAGNIDAQEQDHSKATYTKQIKKEDGLVNLNDNPELNYRKFLAYIPWPSVYFIKDGKRVKITDAELQFPYSLASVPHNSAHKPQFVIKKVIPEGKKEINYALFVKNKMT